MVKSIIHRFHLVLCHVKFAMQISASTHFITKETVDYFDCDNRNRIRLSAAIRYMQKTSCEQMIHLDIPLEKLLDDKVALILTKICLKIHRMPVCRERLVIGTIPVGQVGMKYQREYFIDTESEERLISAFSYWICVNTETHTLIRPSTLSYDWDLRPSFVSDIIGDIAFPKNILSQQIKASIPVRYSDIDWNNHVNNTFYADFVCDALPEDRLSESEFDTFAIAFKKEAVLGDYINVSTEQLNKDDFFLVGNHDRGTCFEAITRFRNRI